MRSHWLRASILIGTLAASATAFAQTVPAGGGTLTGRERFRTHACTKHASPSNASVVFTLGANGAWTAAKGGSTYSGASSTTKRGTALTLDAGSMTALGTALNTAASAVCGTAVTVSNVMVDKATLKVNKRKTKAALRVDTEGTTTGSKKTTDRIRATGPWA